MKRRRCELISAGSAAGFSSTQITFLARHGSQFQHCQNCPSNRSAGWRRWGRGWTKGTWAELEAPERLELSTFPLGPGRSFLLSYGAVEPQAGIEPA